MGYVSKYRGIDIDQAIEFSKNYADIDEKLSKKAEVLHTHKLSDITGLSDLKVSWENIIGKPSVFPCDGSHGGGSDTGGSDGGGNNTGGGRSIRSDLRFSSFWAVTHVFDEKLQKLHTRRSFLIFI